MLHLCHISDLVDHSHVAARDAGASSSSSSTACYLSQVLCLLHQVDCISMRALLTKRDNICSSFWLSVLWLLHRKGLFDPLYYWWDGVVGSEAQERARRRHKRAHSHRHSHHHDAHKRHKTELAGHRRHHVLHIHDDDDPVAAAAAAEHVILRRHGRHEAALGVQHRDGLKLNKHRRHGGKAVALLPPGEIIVRDGGGCGGVEHGDRRHHAWH